MVPDPSTTTRPSTTEAADAETASNTAVNVLVGGIAGIIFGFVPFSPVLGGAITGYLEGGPSDQAVKTGAIAGVIMLVPFAFFGLFVMLVFLGVGNTPIALALFGLFALVIGSVYTVGLSALGGYLGNYLKNEL